MKNICIKHFPIKTIFVLLAIFILLISLPVKSEETKKENILYKIKAEHVSDKNINIKLYTAQKFFESPIPIEKPGLGYVLFLPGTREKLENTPLLTNIEKFISKINVKYYPIKNKDVGYTKIFIKTLEKDIILSIENEVYIPKESTSIEKEEKAENITENQNKEEDQEEKTEKQEDKKELVINKDKSLPKTSMNKEKNTTIEKIIIKKDYSPAVLFILLIITFNIAYLALQKRKKPQYDGKLSKYLNKLTAGYLEKDYLLLFTENEILIDSAYKFCIKNSLNLHVATNKAIEYSKKYNDDKNITLDFSEFSFDEFYKHRDFYNNLNFLPSGVIFDIDPKFKETTSENFDFVSLKKTVDSNYTNLFLIFNLLLKGFNENSGFIIFTDSNIKEKDLTGDKISLNIKLSALKALNNFVKNIKNLNTHKNIEIKYCFNDFIKKTNN